MVRKTTQKKVKKSKAGEIPDFSAENNSEKENVLQDLNPDSDESSSEFEYEKESKVDGEFENESTLENEPKEKSEAKEDLKANQNDIILGGSEEYVNEKLQEAMKVQNPKKRRKSIIVSLILLLVNLVFMAIIIKNLLNDVGDQDIGEIFRSLSLSSSTVIGSFNLTTLTNS